MSQSPIKMAGAVVIEVGAVLLVLALLPGLPWQSWKSAIAGPSNAFASTTQEPLIPNTRYTFQSNGQTRMLTERSFTQPRPWNSDRQSPSVAHGSQPTAPMFSDPEYNERTAVVPETGIPENTLRRLPPPPQADAPERQAYVAETLDRASQRLLESLIGPRSDRTAIAEQSPRVPRPATRPQTQEYLRPELPRETAAPSSRFSAPTQAYQPPAVQQPYVFQAPGAETTSMPQQPQRYQTHPAPTPAAPSYYSQQPTPPATYAPPTTYARPAITAVSPSHSRMPRDLRY